MFAFSINIDAEKLKKTDSDRKTKKKGNRKQKTKTIAEPTASKPK